MDNILVNVLVITYNHEKYIEKSIRSILNQKTNFNFNIIIGEDCSTDSTKKILFQLKKENPDIIKLLIHEKNVGARKNLKQVEELCNAPYIAVLEGDDYWVSEKKLQKQVDFLIENKNFSASVHQINIIDADSKLITNKKVQKNINNVYCDAPIYTEKDLVNGKLPGQSGTMVYRNILNDLPVPNQKLYYETDCNGDARRTVLLLSMGPIYCFKERMSCYRFVSDSGSSWSASIEGRNISDKSFNSYVELEILARSLISEGIDFSGIKKNIGISALLYFIMSPKKENYLIFKDIYKKLDNKNDYWQSFFYVLLNKVSKKMEIRKRG